MKKIFTQSEKKTLTEIYRRLNYLHKGDVNYPLLLLAMPSEVKTLKEKSILIDYSKEIPRVLNWYRLTEDGKELFKKYARKRRLSDKENSALGATHYRWFLINDVLDKKGEIKAWIKTKDDGLRYYRN